jgi:signal transduction histidine kinase
LQLPGSLKTFYEDKEHRIWIGTGKGVFCHDHGQWISVSTNDGLSHPDVRVIYQDRRGDLWFGTYGGGLNRLHDGKITTFCTGRGNYNNRAWWIHEDAEGVFWVGSEDGLNRFVSPGVQESEVQSLQSKVEGQGGGDGFFTFTTKHGLGENVVNNIQEDTFGYLWLSGLRGIYRIPRSELNEVAAGKRAEVECIAFGEADGMLNSECNGGDNQPAGCKDPKGRVWFPTAKGVVVIDPAQIHRNEIPPPLVIEQVKANEEVIYGDGTTENQKSDSRNQKSETGVRIAPGGARVLEIQYTANSLVAPEKVRFRYRLEGYDGHWRDAGDRRVAFYTNLRPGNYRFELKACNHHGVWSQLPAAFAFTVAPHFYETGPFYGLCAASAVMATFGLHYRRVRVLRRIDRLERAQALQTERARIARDLHDNLGANLTGIALKADLAQRQLSGAQGASGPLADIATSTRGLVDQMRETVWALNPKNDTLESLARFLGHLVEHYANSAELRCRLDLPDWFPTIELPSSVRHHLCLVVKEALHNAVKHAGAHEIHFELEMDNETLCLRVADDGHGFQPNSSPPMAPEEQHTGGNGLPNMRQRVLDLGGTLQLDTAPGRGTRLTIRIPTKPPARDEP